MGQYSNDNSGIMHANGDYGVVLFDRADKKFREGWSKESFIRGAFPGVNEMTGGRADLPTGIPTARLGTVRVVDGDPGSVLVLYRAATTTDSEINGDDILISTSQGANGVAFAAATITVSVTGTSVTAAAFKKLCEDGPITGKPGATLKVLVPPGQEGYVLGLATSGSDDGVFSGGLNR